LTRIAERVVMTSAETILVVDPEKCVRESLANALGAYGFNVLCADCASAALAQMEDENVHLVISEAELDGMPGLEMLRYIGEHYKELDLVLTCSYLDIGVAGELLDAGVYDVVEKPFRAHEILLSVRRALQKRKLIVESKDFQRQMEKKVRERTLSLRLRNQEKAQLIVNMIKSLVQTLEAKDKYTEGHSRRVAENALQICQALGMDMKQQEEIHLAGLLHDIGKIGIKESILNKKGRLTEEEYTHIKAHPLIAQRILEPIPQFKALVRVVRHHHEFYDGAGYPDGLVEKQIPLGARILAVCDAYDAMTSHRSYRAALPEEQAMNIIQRNSGTQFDPDLVPVFYRIKGFGQKAS
jgi:cyclic di-GMP phosphodiesterase